MNSRQRRAFKRKYPYVLEFSRYTPRKERESWWDLYDKISFEAMLWCRDSYGKDSCRFRGDFSSFSVRFTNEKHYNWFILRWT